jgi:RyR domain
MPGYTPQPLDTSHVTLPPALAGLLERLAENTHEVWAAQRMQDGWTWGAERDDAQKLHPCLIPYDQLPESEKEYDRKTAAEALKVVIALGFAISQQAVAE